MSYKDEKKIVAGTRGPIGFAVDYISDATNMQEAMKSAEESYRIVSARIKGEPLNKLVEPNRIVGSYADNDNYEIKDGIRVIKQKAPKPTIKPEDVSSQGFFEGMLDLNFNMNSDSDK